MLAATDKATARAYIERKQAELRELNEKIHAMQRQAARIEAGIQYCKELMDELSGVAMNGAGDGNLGVEILRTGSHAEKIHRILTEAGKPLYIDEILDLMGGEKTQSVRNSLVSALGRHHNRRQVFLRTAALSFIPA